MRIARATLAIDNCIGHRRRAIRICACKGNAPAVIVDITITQACVSSRQNDDSIPAYSDIHCLLNRVERMLTAAVLAWVTEIGIVGARVAGRIIINIESKRCRLREGIIRHSTP